VQELQLTYKNSLINYYRFGSGNKTAICFHGYGETAASFLFLEKYAGHEFSFYAIDLPLHGKTEWKEGLSFEPGDLLRIVENICGTKSKWTLIGFSLGGRVALSLYQATPGQIEKLVLIAPDGLKINSWYWLATQTRAGNRFFSFTMKNPGWFFGLLKLLNGLKLVNASIFKFVNYYIGDEQVRHDLYDRWTCLRKLKPVNKTIKSFIKKYGTQLRLIYGKHDRIILPGPGERFCKGIESNCRLSIIHAGHQVLHEKHIGEIFPALLD
jgi:pimeloyl-ACP methyl ester carboxylesterase